MIPVGLVTEKVGMSRVVDKYGSIIAVTVLKVKPQQITKILDIEKNGYSAVQVGFDEVNSFKRITLADRGRLKKIGISKLYSKFKEFRFDSSKTPKSQSVMDYKIGQELKAEDFKDVTKVDATSYTRGRGFQGAIKRWKYSISAMSHGSRYHRRTGSIGNCSTPGRVFKGKKMPGRYGNEKRTIKKMSVMMVDQELNVIAIKGSVPGTKGVCVELRAVS